MPKRQWLEMEIKNEMETYYEDVGTAFLSTQT